MRKSSRAQADLFVTQVEAAELVGAERQMAVTLLQALLMEALMRPDSRPLTSCGEEVGDE